MLASVRFNTVLGTVTVHGCTEKVSYGTREETSQVKDFCETVRFGRYRHFWIKPSVRSDRNQWSVPNACTEKNRQCDSGDLALLRKESVVVSLGIVYTLRL
jgi:hypothetical protein